MKKVELNMNAQEKYEIIKATDQNDNKLRAAIKLGCTVTLIVSLKNITRKARLPLSTEIPAESLHIPCPMPKNHLLLLFIRINIGIQTLLIAANC